MSRIIAATATDLEAGAGAAVLATLRVEGEQLAGEHARQRRLLVGTVVHAGRSLAAVNTRVGLSKVCALIGQLCVRTS